MSGGATNKWKGSVESGLKALLQPELHVKILNLVADRINPLSDCLELDKMACGSCVNKTHSPTPNSSKRISIKPNRQKQIARNGNKSAKDLGKTQANTQVTSLSHSQLVTKDLIVQKRRIMQIQSKVVAYTVENTTVSNFTVDLRPALNSQFVNAKMLHHLKLDNLQKQQRIKELETELERVTKEIKEVKQMASQDCFRKNKAFSEQYMPVSTDEPRLHNNYNSMKEGNFSSYCQRFDEQSIMLPSSSQKSLILPPCDKQQDYQFLLRIIKTQAVELQKTKSLTNRQRIFSRLS